MLGTISMQAQAQTKTEELIHTEIPQPDPDGHVSQQQHRFLEALQKMPHYRGAQTAHRPCGAGRLPESIQCLGGGREGKQKEAADQFGNPSKCPAWNEIPSRIRSRGSLYGT